MTSQHNLLITLFFLCLLNLQAAPRVWTSKAGTKIEAEVVELKNQTLTLKTKDSRIIKLNMTSLIQEDQKIAKREARLLVPIALVFDPESLFTNVIGTGCNPVELLTLVSDFNFKTFGVPHKDDDFFNNAANVNDPFKAANEALVKTRILNFKKAQRFTPNIYFYDNVQFFSVVEDDYVLDEQFTALKQTQKSCEQHNVNYVLPLPFARNDVLPFNPDIKATFERIKILTRKSHKIKDVQIISSLPIIKILPKISPLWKDQFIEAADENLLRVAALHSMITGEPAKLASLHNSPLQKEFLEIQPAAQGPVPAWPNFDEQTLTKLALEIHRIVQQQ